MATATEMMRIDLRLRRAQMLAAAVMQKVSPFLDETQHSVRRDVYDALIELFHTEGADVITDRDRADAGLEPRGPEGWTDAELVALEKRRLEFMTAPIVTTVDGETWVFDQKHSTSSPKAK